MQEAASTGMLIAYHAQQAPDRMAVTTVYGERTFDELNGRINQLARVFRNAGLQPDDAVALLLVNRCEFLEVYYAAMRTGLRVTPINWHLTGDDAAYIVENCEARAFVADVECANVAKQALSQASGVAVALAVGGNIEGFDDYGETVGQQASHNIEDPSSGSQMLYTSGTTGRPKGVYRDRLARRGALAAAAQPNQAAPAAAAGAPAAQAVVGRAGGAAAYNPETDRALCTGPGYHAAPLAFNIVSPIAQGVGIVMMDRWDAEECLRLVEQHKITHTHMVATMFHRLLSLPQEVRSKYDSGSLRYVLHGAAPCPVHVKQAMMDWLGPVIHEYYAATEGGGGFFIGPEDWLKKPGSVGKAPETNVNKIVDEEGNELPQGEIGTIYFQAPQVGRFEYFKDSKKTAASYMGDFFTLGDMGYFDSDGYLFLTGRNAETIISGGVNIYPQETDNVLLKHPAVADVCTIGIPNEEWGEEVKSVIQLSEGYGETKEMEEELISFCRDGLPAFKSPRSIDFVHELPRLPSGKIQRRKVREPYWEGMDKQI
jgi:long-chain acyl-CoA synthetase|tara:strand:+ start:1365 stop:2990 length:1626 start_codon:yes stop_codon:yes gene_type:complete